MTPESQLINYLLRFQELYASTGFLNNSFPNDMKEIDNSFEKTISKLKLLSIIHEKYVIGVSGFQGAGKTTLMNWYLFDTPLVDHDNWLPQNLGVGENLPVLITVKKNVDKIEAVLYEVIKYSEEISSSPYSSIKETIIDQPADVQQIVKQPKNNYLLIELIVPLEKQIKGFQNSSVLEETSFLLLPGYEVINDEMDDDKIYRQEYMRLALRACANTIIVLDPSSVMQQEKENVLSEITEIFHDTNAIYVLTHKDVKSAVNAVEYLNNIFHVNKDSIIESGTENDNYSRSDIDIWREKLTAKVAENVSSKNKFREIQKKNITRLIAECSSIIREVDRIKEKIELKNSDGERKLHELFQKYDESISKISKKYFQLYDEKIDRLLNATYDLLDKDNYNKGFGEKVGAWFKTKYKGPEPISYISELFIEKFNSIIKEQGGSEALLLKIYNQTQNDLGVYSDLKFDGDLDSLKKNALHNTIPKDGYRLSEGIIRNIQFLVGSNSIHSQSNKLNDPDKDFEKAMSILPYLIFEIQRFQIISDGKPLLKIFEDNGHVPASDSFLNHFGQSGANVKSFLAGIASLFGTDLLPDGNLDNIGALFAALFGSTAKSATGSVAGGAAVNGTTAAAAGGTSVLGVVTGIAVGLIVLSSIIKASIRHGLKKMSIIYEIKNFQKDMMKSNIRTNFYTTFQRARNLIEFRLGKYAFNNHDLGYKLKLENRIQNCNSASTELRESIRNES